MTLGYPGTIVRPFVMFVAGLRLVDLVPCVCELPGIFYVAVMFYFCRFSIGKLVVFFVSPRFCVLQAAFIGKKSDARVC